MDVLFNSIDVRDLLSSHDLDDSSPLSAPDLRLLIDRLHLRSLHIKSQVHHYLLSHRRDFEGIFAAGAASALSSAEISDSVADLLRLFSDRPVDLEIRDTIREIGDGTREVREKKEVLGLVTAIAELSRRLRSVREEVSDGKLVRAAEMVRDLKTAIRVCEVEENEPVVYGFLRKEWQQCFEEIQEVLLKFMENAVHFEKEDNRLRIRYQLSVKGINGIRLEEGLEAMDVIGILDHGLAKVADLIVKHVVNPAVNQSSPVSFVEGPNEDSNHMTEMTLNIIPSMDCEVVEMDGEAIYSKIIWIVNFVYKFICLQNGSWLQCFGRLTWPRISELIISNFLSKVVPDDASELANFQKIISGTSDFESVLKGMMFISASDSKDKQLSSFAENVEVHFASRKKTEILAKTRNLLLYCDFSLPEDFMRRDSNLRDDMTSNRTVELLFSSERLVISEAASELMKLVHQTLQDVCVSSTRVALEFYHAARDAILLYEAVIPVKLERQLDGINPVAALVHNDCLYLSQEILGLAYEYRPGFPVPIKEHTVFVDLAPRFQQMAEQILQKHIQLVTFKLGEALDGADGFQNTHLMQQYETAKFSINQVIFILEKVHIILEPLLLPSTYRTSMCIILETVFSRMVKDILLLDDMAAEETLQLQRLIHLMLENISSVLDSLIHVNQQNLLADNSSEPLSCLLVSLRRIRKLADLLDMPLKSITESWESGDLASCDFTFAEVEDFIKSTFTDTPLRRECLLRMRNTNF